MPEEKVFQLVDSECGSSSEYEQNESADEEFFDPLPHVEEEKEEVNDKDEDENEEEEEEEETEEETEEEEEEEKGLEIHEDQNPTSVIELTHTKKKAMLELRCRVEDAILSNNLLGKHKRIKAGDESNISVFKENLRDIKIWGIPLLPSKGHEGTDIVLMKFLRAKDYRVSEAFHMLRKTMKWRRENKIDEILKEEFSPEHENMWSVHGKDKEGRPICYYMLDALKDRGLRHKILGSEVKFQEFVRWRIQCIERGIRNILFKEGDINSMIQIIDLKNSPSLSMREFEFINKKILPILQEYYPGIIYKNLIINIPIWFMAFNALNLRVLTQRSRNKVLFVRSAKVIDTLLKFITPENILVQYGGLRREKDIDFTGSEKVLEVRVKANSTSVITIPIYEADVTVTWGLTVIGYEVTYKEEFIPSDDCSYKVLLTKEKKMGGSIYNLFHIREPGKIVITIENATYKKKKGYYRYKTKPSVPLYMLTE